MNRTGYLPNSKVLPDFRKAEFCALRLTTRGSSEEIRNESA